MVDPKKKMVPASMAKLVIDPFQPHHITVDQASIVQQLRFIHGFMEGMAIQRPGELVVAAGHLQRPDQIPLPQQ